MTISSGVLDTAAVRRRRAEPGTAALVSDLVSDRRDFVPVGRVEDFLPGTARTVRAGDEQVAVMRVGDEFYATQGACLHLKGPLGEGRLEDHVVTCPWHGWQYDVRTGKNEFDLAIELETYEVRVENGEVQVAV
jgi:nitrite reductase (NADH) small subunit